MKRLWYLSVILLPIGWILGCQVPKNQFSDPHLLEIGLLQDKRKSDSLLLYLDHPDSIYRAAAALAFGSVQDTMIAYHLGNRLLEDETITVRINAAFALGQTGSFQAVNSLLPALKDPESKVVREVLEALGKTITTSDLPQLNAFQPQDSLQQEGMAWALYRLALRNLTDSISIAKASEFLNGRYSFETRLAAAHFFARSSVAKKYGVQSSIVYAASHEKSVEVRMAIVQGLKHVSAEIALPLIRDILNRQEDERVKISAIRACLAFEFDQTHEALRIALRDPHQGVQIAASEAIRSKAKKNEQLMLSQEVKDAADCRVKSNLMAAMIKAHQVYTFTALLKEYDQADLYGRSHMLSAIGELENDLEAFAFLSQNITNKSEPAVIRTAAAEALVKMQKLSDQIKPEEFLKICRTAMTQEDVAVIGILASALSDPANGFQKIVSDVSFLEDAKKSFKLPRDIESLQPVIEAIAFLKGEEKPKPVINPFNHTINQDLLRSIPVRQLVVVETTKGKIVLQLLVEEAPGSVVNFIELVRQQYFDGKVFHRVVPNFVIQTGCSRGDGYGSEDYSIRSEFSLTRYREGAVGMASAGKDTEGTQWFITHSPTPHLDGRYSIFAQVVEGMEVVRNMGVGDKILSVRESP